MNSFSPDRIFIVYGHSGELIRGKTNTNTFMNNVEKAEEEFERYVVPPETFTANVVPASLAAPTFDISVYYHFLNTRIPIPDQEKSRSDYKKEIQLLGSLLYKKSIIDGSDPNPGQYDSTARQITSLSINPEKAESVTRGPQLSWEKFRTHGPRPLEGRNATPTNEKISEYLFTAPNNRIGVFTSQSVIKLIRKGVLKLGFGMTPSGAMRLTDLQRRFPTGYDDDPLFIDSLVNTKTIGQMYSNDGNCVSSLEGTPEAIEFKQRLSSPGEALVDLVRQELDKFKRRVVWDILPIPGTSTVMTNTTIDNANLWDIYNKKIRSEEIVRWIRQAAGPGPILIVFQHCRSYRLKDNILKGDNESYLNNSFAKGQVEAAYKLFKRPMLARTLSNRAQGLGGGSRKKLKRVRRGKSNTRRR